MAAVGETSRKRAASGQQGASHINKRFKTNNGRFQIRAQNSEQAINSNGELDVGAFIKAREFEIRALEDNMAASKKTSNTRAFQQVPRELRRRTASHNVKRVPERLRRRAAKEMKEDNTPIVEVKKREKSTRQHLRAQNAKKIPELAKRIEKKKENETKNLKAGTLPEKNELAVPKPTHMKHKKRQIHKSWLPTHVWHAKRATMTPPLEPLWRFAIPLTSTEKTARVTGRSSRLRGCVAWDVSYMSTISITGSENSILGIFRSLHASERSLTGKTSEAWKFGSRSQSFWLSEHATARQMIAKVLSIWRPRQEGNNQRQAFLRVHPSAFLQLWKELLKVVETQDPALQLEDLRFQIGSIDVAGPAALEALTGVLSTTEDDTATQQPAVWCKLAAIQDSYTVPKGAILNLLVADPRLGQPHQSVPQASLVPNEETMSLATTWHSNTTAPNTLLFDSLARHKAVRSLPTQSAINKRKGEALAGQKPEPLPNDPKIPILLVANNHGSKTQNPGSWTFIMPWDCVLSTWHCLLHYPLNAGGNPRFGGLQEQHQLSFEDNKPWFPGDFPGTEAGWQWELDQRKKWKAEWDRKPKSRRVEWSTLDLNTKVKGEIGLGWACDWKYLCDLDKPQTETADPGVVVTDGLPPGFHQLISPTLDAAESFSPSCLVTISISLVSRGVASACARIYQLPLDATAREQWLKQLDRQEKTTTGSVPSSAAAAIPETPLPAGKDGIPALNHVHTPAVPESSDLIGFVTTGNFNLAQGKGTGIGSVVWTRVVNEAKQNKSGVLHGLCIVRDAGQKVGRLARWQVVSS